MPSYLHARCKERAELCGMAANEIGPSDVQVVPAGGIYGAADSWKGEKGVVCGHSSA